MAAPGDANVTFQVGYWDNQSKHSNILGAIDCLVGGRPLSVCTYGDNEGRNSFGDIAARQLAVLLKSQGNQGNVGVNEVFCGKVVAVCQKYHLTTPNFAQGKAFDMVTKS